MNINIWKVENDNGLWYCISFNGKTVLGINYQPQLFYKEELQEIINNQLKEV